MSTFQQPSHAGKWLCKKCHTWCTAQVQRCSWCGTKRPVKSNKNKKKNK